MKWKKEKGLKSGGEEKFSFFKQRNCCLKVIISIFSDMFTLSHLRTGENV